MRLHRPTPISGHSLQRRDRLFEPPQQRVRSRCCARTFTRLLPNCPRADQRSQSEIGRSGEPPARAVVPLHRGADRVAVRQAPGSRPSRSPRRTAGPGCRASRTAGRTPTRCAADLRSASAPAAAGYPARRAACRRAGRRPVNTSSRCSSVNRLRSSSSWLRRKVAHCAFGCSRGRPVRDSTRVSASDRASASHSLRVQQEREHHVGAVVGSVRTCRCTWSGRWRGRSPRRAARRRRVRHCRSCRQRSRMVKSFGAGRHRARPAPTRTAPRPPGSRMLPAAARSP